jgi:hypothetical protein
MKNTQFNQQFELGSNIRLPFEPKGEALALREELRNGLEKLEPRKYNHLIASLATNEKAFFDVENVLFYNIGSGAFSHLMLDELSFSLKESDKWQREKYKYVYGLEEKEHSREISDPVMEFCFTIDKMASNKKPLDYWYAFKNGKIKLIDFVKPKKFGLYIGIKAPQKYPNLTGLIKPLLDGIISAFHYQNPIEPGAISFIAEKLKIENEELVMLFDQHDYEFLGERNLVSCYRNGIKWNPEDEKCTSVNIKQEKALVNEVMISGKVEK